MIRNLLNFSPRQKSALVRLLDSDVVDRVLSDDEQTRQAMRRGLAERVKALRHEAERNLPAAESAVREASSSVARAQAALHAAQAMELEARNRLNVITRTKPVSLLERELRESADPRILEFREWLFSIRRGAVPAAYQSTWGVAETGRGPSAIVSTNSTDVAAAFAALDEAIQRTYSAELDVELSGWHAVTSWLSGLCTYIAPSLAVLSLNPPAVDVNGELGRPMPWRGRPEWVVDRHERSAVSGEH